MNERIEEIEKQAYTEVMHERGGTYMAFDKEKFAQLIVRECARVYWNINDGEIHGEYVKALKEHFGIEK
jgi:hypothetical protein